MNRLQKLLKCLLSKLNVTSRLALNNIALRQQLIVLKRGCNKPPIPTVTFKILFVLVILNHDRRKVLHFNITSNPTAEWTSRQIIEAFPWDTAPKHLIRDRDGIYGNVFRERLKNMGIHEILTSPQSPWQNGYAERLIGSIRRDCLDHVIVLSEHHLRLILKSYFEYYHQDRTHLGIEKDTPVVRAIQHKPTGGELIKLPRVGGLHHRYMWKKAA